MTSAALRLSDQIHGSQRHGDSSRAVRRWSVLASLLLAILPACQPPPDTAADRHAKAVKALINLGAEVFDDEDKVAHEQGTFVVLFHEHFTREGLIQSEVLRLIREIQSLFLDVTNTPISDDAMTDLARMPNIRVLNLTQTKVTDRGLKLISASRDLRLLKLNRTRITAEGLALLADMPSLKMLYLGDTRLTDDAMPVIAGLPQLEALKLTRLPITDDGLRPLRELPRLQFLGLDGTAVTDAALKHLELLPKLVYLDVQGTAVSLDAINDFRDRHRQCHVEY
jgi:hypothetical protein